MGIINVTPDSFYEPSRVCAVDEVLRRAESMIKAGADILDIGGESTRPMALSVSAEEELARVIPVVEALRKHFTIKISVDTSCALVMRQALEAGADMINDVRALSDAAAMAVVRAFNVPVCIMHMQNDPKTMQITPYYDDVVTEVYNFLHKRCLVLQRAGIHVNNIIIDPGIGFGKTVQHNLLLLKNLQKFKKLGCKILIGVSRKSFIAKVLCLDEQDDRLIGSVAASIVAFVHGADILRVHDVAQTKQAIDVAHSIVSCEV